MAEIPLFLNPISLVMNRLALLYLILLLLFLFSVFRYRKRILSILNIPKTSIIILLIIMALGFFVRFMNFQYYPHSESEHGDYVNQGISIMNGENPKVIGHPMFYAYLLSLCFRMFGPDIIVVGVFNSIVGMITIAIVFMLSLLITKDVTSSLLGALMFALAPGPLFYLYRGGDMTILIFFTSVIFFALFLFIRDRNMLSLALLIVSLMISLQIRNNSIFIIAVITLATILYWRNIYPFIKKRKNLYGLVFLAAVIVISFIPVWHSMAFDLKVQYRSACPSIDEEIISDDSNCMSRIRFWYVFIYIFTNYNPGTQIEEWNYPILLLPIILLSFVSFRKDWKTLSILFFHMVFLITVYTQSVDYVHDNAIQRFFSVTIISYSAILSLGIRNLTRLSDNRMLRRFLVLSLIALILFTGETGRVIAPQREDHQSGVDVHEACLQIPDEGVLIFLRRTYNAMYFHCYPYTKDRLFSEFQDPDDVLLMLGYRRVFVAHKDGVYPYSDSYTNKYLSNFYYEIYWNSTYVNLYEIKGIRN